MKTLKCTNKADLLRMPENTKFRLINRFGKIIDEPRELLKCRSNSLIFLKDGKKSYLDLPPASRIEFTGNGFKIYGVGERDLTEKEKAVLDNQPRDTQQEERDILTDTNVMFYRQKEYFINSGMPHLLVYNKGTHLVYDENNIPKVRDINIRGKLELEYILD